MRKVLIVFSMLTGGFAGASTMSMGPTANGQRYYKMSGCDSIANLTRNLPNGYTVEPKVNWKNDIWICGQLDLIGKDMVDLLSQVAQRTQDCLNIQIDRSSKKVEIQAGPELKYIKQSTQSTTTYEVNGQVAYVEPKSSQKVVQMCVFDPSGLKDLAPYNLFIR